MSIFSNGFSLNAQAGPLVDPLFIEQENLGLSYNNPSNISGGNAMIKNFLIGADFAINPFQRGTTFNSIATATYTADRFRVDYSTTGTADVTNPADGPTVAQAGIYTNSSLKIACTSTASVLAGSYFKLSQVIEGYTFTNFAQLPFCFSFWVKSFQTGVYCIAFANSAFDKNYVVPYTVTASNTWQKIVIPMPATPSSGTWLYTNGAGLYVSWILMAGSTYQGTANQWTASQIYATSDQVNFFSSTNNTFQIDIPQLELGTIATPFERNTSQQVLSACQRYYNKTFAQGVAPVQNVGTANGCVIYRVTNTGVNTSGANYVYPVVMRDTPATITTYNPNAANTKWRDTTVSADSGTPSLLNASDRMVYVTNPQVAGDSTIGNVCAVHVTCDAEL